MSPLDTTPEASAIRTDAPSLRVLPEIVGLSPAALAALVADYSGNLEDMLHDCAIRCDGCGKLFASHLARVDICPDDQTGEWLCEDCASAVEPSRSDLQVHGTLWAINGSVVG
jgi:hypothetical protein